MQKTALAVDMMFNTDKTGFHDRRQHNVLMTDFKLCLNPFRNWSFQTINWIIQNDVHVWHAYFSFWIIRVYHTRILFSVRVWIKLCHCPYLGQSASTCHVRTFDDLQLLQSYRIFCVTTQWFLHVQRSLYGKDYTEINICITLLSWWRQSDANFVNNKSYLIYSSTVWVKKNPPRRFSDIFSQTVRNFWSKFYMPIIRSYLR